MSQPIYRGRIAVVVGLLGFALAGFLRVWADRAVAAEAVQITIFHTNSVTGHLFPCPS